MLPRLIVIDEHVLLKVKQRITEGVRNTLDELVRRPQVLSRRFLSTLEVDRCNLDLVKLEYERVIKDYERVSGKRARVVAIEVVDDGLNEIPASDRWPDGAPT